jgi:hypothetical protein
MPLPQNPESVNGIIQRLQNIESRLETIESRLNEGNTRSISEPSLESFIDDILNDPETNTIIPDSIERNFYRKLLLILIKILQKSVDTTRISIFNHDIGLVMNGTDSTNSPSDHS